MSLPRFILPVLALGWLNLAGAEVPSYPALREGDIVHGFRATHSYLDYNDRPTGGRFVHVRSGFVLDLLEIQSVPQSMIWVRSYPSSDMGEPHTQEHLLIDKGNKGRAQRTRHVMSLVRFQAFTSRSHTCYHSFTDAGPEVWFAHFEGTLDALLHPDYTDEEVRREVRNFGVRVGADGALGLEEKGTVYNEMVTSMDQATWRLTRVRDQLVYGANHPLAFESGGTPEALRTLKPEDIRRFHQAHYFLGNMGMIAALPRDVMLGDALRRIDAALTRLEPEPIVRPILTEAMLPPPQPAPAGSITYVPFPYRNEQQPGHVILAWRADRQLSVADRELANLFLANVASDPATNLYKRFIDRRTREMDLGAQSVGAFIDSAPGQSVRVAFGNVPVARLNDPDLADLRTRVLDEFAKIAAYPDGSAELAAFNARLRSRLVATRRARAKMVESPPGFGMRSTGTGWLNLLEDLSREPGFAKSLIRKPELAAIEKQITDDRNPWRERVREWRLVDGNPYVLAAKPSVELLRQQQTERDQRIAAETERLVAHYGVADQAEALRRYQADYDRASADLDAAATRTDRPKFVDHPPLTYDDHLEYEVTQRSGVPVVTSTFRGMSSATAGVAFRISGVSEPDLVLLPLLPEFMNSSGVIENGTPLTSEQVLDRRRNEILSLNVMFRSNPRSQRDELLVQGNGNTAEEGLKALAWMRLVLFHPNWTAENLPRLRDLADQAFTRLLNVTQGREETWVHSVASGYRYQDNPIYLSTQLAHTEAHHVFRVRWMLKDAGSGESRAAALDFLQQLAATTPSRAEAKTLLAELRTGSHPRVASLPPSAKSVASDAARDLERFLPDLPEDSLARDWRYLCERMHADLQVGPDATLQAFRRLRQSLVNATEARCFVVGSPETHAIIGPDVAAFLAELPRDANVPQPRAARRRVDDRLRERTQTNQPLRYVGLLHPNTQGGVFQHTAPYSSESELTRERLLDFLAANTFARGDKSVFAKTVASGLAYSNGLAASESTGLISYTAERTPDLPTTLQFVIDHVTKSDRDPSMIETGYAGAFYSRASFGYENRGATIASDLADGETPEKIARFRRALHELHKSPGLADEVFARVDGLLARVLPGMPGRNPDLPGTVTFVIGPERQFASYEAYLKRVDGPDAVLHRLYPRDFWLVPAPTTVTPSTD